MDTLSLLLGNVAVGRFLTPLLEPEDLYAHFEVNLNCDVIERVVLTFPPLILRASNGVGVELTHLNAKTPRF